MLGHGLADTVVVILLIVFFVRGGLCTQLLGAHAPVRSVFSFVISVPISPNSFRGREPGSIDVSQESAWTPLSF